MSDAAKQAQVRATEEYKKKLDENMAREAEEKTNVGFSKDGNNFKLEIKNNRPAVDGKEVTPKVFEILAKIKNGELIKAEEALEVMDSKAVKDLSFKMTPKETEKLLELMAKTGRISKEDLEEAKKCLKEGKPFSITAGKPTRELDQQEPDAVAAKKRAAQSGFVA
ncbi:MAG: hypothetical protein FWD89_03735 [Firmicutes bacterium]|nr:hypothetical protein [Bacillota bacterium]